MCFYITFWETCAVLYFIKNCALEKLSFILKRSGAWAAWLSGNKFRQSCYFLSPQHIEVEIINPRSLSTRSKWCTQKLRTHAHHTPQAWPGRLAARTHAHHTPRRGRGASLPGPTHTLHPRRGRGASLPGPTHKINYDVHSATWADGRPAFLPIAMEATELGRAIMQRPRLMPISVAIHPLL
jgi:hypothetical protein